MYRDKLMIKTQGYDAFMLLGHAGVVIIHFPLPCKEERSEGALRASV